jgi:hypothetical protein
LFVLNCSCHAEKESRLLSPDSSSRCFTIPLLARPCVVSLPLYTYIAKPPLVRTPPHCSAPAPPLTTSPAHPLHVLNHVPLFLSTKPHLLHRERSVDAPAFAVKFVPYETVFRNVIRKPNTMAFSDPASVLLAMIDSPLCLNTSTFEIIIEECDRGVPSVTHRSFSITCARNSITSLHIFTHGRGIGVFEPLPSQGTYKISSP